MKCWFGHDYVREEDDGHGNVKIKCKKCGNWRYDWDSYRLWREKNPREANPEWICPLCEKCKIGEGWENTKDVDHINIHLQIEIRNKPRRVVYRNCYPQWDGTDI